jgi:hypothetical protein
MSMASVSIDQTRAGMVLAADVVDRRGRLLIPAGRALSEKHVGALRMWGVDHVEIQGEHVEEGPATTVAPEQLAQAEQEVGELFRNASGDHPFLSHLRRVSAERRALALAEDLEKAGAA